MACNFCFITPYSMFNFYGVYSGLFQVPAKTDFGVAFLLVYSIDMDLNIVRCLNTKYLLFVGVL